jgi:cyclopropane-fatty-acyl-phospholipid synthase
MLKKIVFGFLSKPGFKGALEVDYKGEKFIFGKEVEGEESIKTAKADMRILSDAFFRRVLFYGETGFGESYFLGEIETDNLKNLLLYFIRNKSMLPGFGANKATAFYMNWGNFILRLYNLLKKNTKIGSKKNIKAHYDVSNDFYKLWLDPTMTYSSALFKDTDDLQTAQENKYRSICEKSDLKPSDHVLEIGCGWGGFAVFAAKNYGCRLTITTISDEQFDYAHKKIQSEGLEDKINLIKKDYRDLEGRFDKIVSIEMMEALGREYVPVFMKKCESLLKPDGSICVQCIMYPDEHFKEYLARTDYTRKFIFPGGELLSLNEIKNNAASLHMKIDSVERMGQSYAKTLNHWSKNFTAKKEQIKSLGFDENFYRKWLYYFVFCEVGFEADYVDVAQILIKKSNE